MAYRAYRLPMGEPENTTYDIYIEGERTQAFEARVSAMPFNRHWPGHQRPLDQTELVPFVRFGLDSPVALRVVAGRDFREVVVRPLARGIKPVVRGREILFTVPGPGQYTLELDGPHGALHLFADSVKEYGIRAGDPDTVYFGPGVHDAGTIELKSGQTLYIDAEAVVYGQIRATDADHIRILGQGILDHSRMDADAGGIAQAKGANGELIDPVRPSPVVLSYCRDVEIDGIVIRDPCFLALRPIACENITIDNVKIIGCWRYNSDGIDIINSRHCRVRNCFVRSFDDSLCLKGFYFLHQGEMFHNRQVYAVMDDVVFENCVVWNEWGKALEVGVDLCAMEIKNCAFRDCYVIHCHGTAVMDLSNVDYAEVHDILFEGIHAEYDNVIQQPAIQESDDHVFLEDRNSTYMPYLLLSTICFSPYSHGGTVRGSIHDITIRNVAVHANRMPPSCIAGYDGTHMIKSVLLDQLSLNNEKIVSLADMKLQVGEYVSDVKLY